MDKMMFLYESLHSYQKDLIDEEIEEYIKKMIITNRGFNYTESQFQSLINEIVIYGKQVNSFLGEAVNCFNLKQLVVKSRAIKIAYELEQSNLRSKTKRALANKREEIVNQLQESYDISNDIISYKYLFKDFYMNTEKISEPHMEDETVFVFFGEH
ncbi:MULTISPECIES: hypothetical protein [unclassified Lysinibacillus]|uniref:hypothetical protein n=1 Tax=unclassified Lysinibacillus TaxID=2636778 RepID=UPI0011177EA5|nr:MULTISPECIES: hypothetical protein [unclassified Lysinibacillus]